MSPKPTHSFNVLLEPEEMDMLKTLAHSTRTNMSIVLRQALKYRYAMEIQNAPTCANGRPCFVPHMHSTAQPPEGTSTS